jgi:hypothetical protein
MAVPVGKKAAPIAFPSIKHRERQQFFVGNPFWIRLHTILKPFFRFFKYENEFNT